MMKHHPPPLIVLTGAPGVGKTRLCMQATRILQQMGADVAGCLSPARMEGGRKTGIFVENIVSGERRLLAGPRTGEHGWELDSAALQWGAAILTNSPAADVLVVDELGPLELSEGKGWAAVCEVLMDHPVAAMIVVRPSLIDKLRQRLPGREITVLEVTEPSPSAEEVAALLWTAPDGEP